MASVFALSQDHSPVSQGHLTISVRVITVVECTRWDLCCLRTRTEKHYCLLVPWNHLGYSVGDWKAEGGHLENQSRIRGMVGGNSEVGKDSGLMSSPEQLERVPGTPRVESRNILCGAVVTCHAFCPFLGHSMMDTLAVALRVAEEAIEEAISKAESHGDSLVGPPSVWWEATRWEPGDQERVPMVRGHVTAALSKAVCDPSLLLPGLL